MKEPIKWMIVLKPNCIAKHKYKLCNLVCLYDSLRIIPHAPWKIVKFFFLFAILIKINFSFCLMQEKNNIFHLLKVFHKHFPRQTTHIWKQGTMKCIMVKQQHKQHKKSNLCKNNLFDGEFLIPNNQRHLWEFNTQILITWWAFMFFFSFF